MQPQCSFKRIGWLTRMTWAYGIRNHTGALWAKGLRRSNRLSVARTYLQAGAQAGIHTNSGRRWGEATRL